MTEALIVFTAFAKRGGCRARGAGAGRRAPDRVRQPAARGAFALSLEGRGGRRAGDDRADEDPQAGLGGADVPALTSCIPTTRPSASQCASPPALPSTWRGSRPSLAGASDTRRPTVWCWASRRRATTRRWPCSRSGARLRSHLIASQDLHRLYGGVVPELAARAHLELLPRLTRRALTEAEVAPEDLTGMAVTRAPGLVGSLVVGVAFAARVRVRARDPGGGGEPHRGPPARRHARARRKPVAGGEPGRVRAVTPSWWRCEASATTAGSASTRDDAAGEAFDKVAKRLGLGFPGGPHVDGWPPRGTPRPSIFRGRCSIVPTSTSRSRDSRPRWRWRPRRRRAAPYPRPLLARSVAPRSRRRWWTRWPAKTVRALEHVQSAGAHARAAAWPAIAALRARLARECEARGVALRVPTPRLCADNAAMVALVGAWTLVRRRRSVVARGRGLAGGVGTPRS